MSTRQSPKIKFHHYNDCREEGCPGHELQIFYHHTSDTTRVEVDGVIHSVFDDGAYEALLKAEAEFNKEEGR